MSDIGSPPPVPPSATGDLPQVSPSAGTSDQAPARQPTVEGTSASTREAPKQPTPPSPAVTLAATLARVPTGSELTGIIIGADAEGLPVLRTPSATFVLSKALALPPNSQITLQIQTVGNDLRAALLTVNGQVQHPPPTVDLTLTTVTPQPQQQTPLTAGLNPPPAQSSLPPSTLAPGSQVAALVVPAIAEPHHTFALPGEVQTVRLAPGTPLTLQVTSVVPPQGTAVVAQALATALATTATPDTSQAAAAGSSTSGQATSPTLANIVTQQGLALGPEQPAQGPTEQLALNTPANAVAHTHITGVVTGSTPDGGLLVNTPNGMLALDTRAALLPETQINFTALPTNHAAQAAVASEAAGLAAAGPFQPINTVSEFAIGWPALREAIVLLQAAEPRIAQQVLSATVPAANGQLTAGVLLFMSALRGGDVRSWIGSDAAQALERLGRRDLLARLAGDFQQMGRVTEMPVVGDWRTLMFPFFDGQDLQQIWAFYRELKREQQEDRRNALRFVVELELSALGDMQLDGLVNDRRFDLIVRSLGGLSDTMRQEITTIFEDSIGATGLTGTLTFSAGEAFPQSPFREAWHESLKGEVLA